MQYKSVNGLLRTAFTTYTLISRISEGGNAFVWKGKSADGSDVAIKILKVGLNETTKGSRFRNEINFCVNHNHNNIIRIIDHGIVDSDGKWQPFYVMELFGDTLRGLIKLGIAPNDGINVVGQILNGLEAAHLRGASHRDIKPENILINKSPIRCVIADFGIARFNEDEMASAVKTGDGDRLANFKYAAPEQRNGQPASEKSDVYSAGAVINEIFTGICPHGVGYKTIGSVAPDFDYLDEIVGRMLRSSPEDRPTISDVKALIAVRQRDFPLRQKVRSDDSKIVYESEVEDPIVREPLRIIDADFRDGKILFVLSQPTNNIWRDMFANLSGVEYTPTMHPRYLQIVDREIIIPNGIGLPPSAIRDYVSKYIDSVNLQYRDLVLRQAQMRIDAERKRREDEVKDQERRQAIRRQLGFGPNEEGTA